jgi:hypothetical protein
MIGKIPITFWNYLAAEYHQACQHYREFVEKGIVMGRRADLTGGDLIRKTTSASNGQKLALLLGSQGTADERFRGCSKTAH